MNFCCKSLDCGVSGMIDTLIELATEAGVVIRRIYESGNFNTSLKSDNSPVTTADEEANDLILGVLRQKYLQRGQFQNFHKNYVLHQNQQHFQRTL